MTNQPKLTVDFFIDFYSGIPANRWTTGLRTECTADGVKHCALGLLRSEFSEVIADPFSAEIFLISLPLVDKNEIPNNNSAIVRANNGIHDPHGAYKKYQSLKTPKARVLAFLNDVKKLQSK